MKRQLIQAPYKPKSWHSSRIESFILLAPIITSFFRMIILPTGRTNVKVCVMSKELNGRKIVARKDMYR